GEAEVAAGAVDVLLALEDLRLPEGEPFLKPALDAAQLRLSGGDRGLRVGAEARQRDLESAQEFERFDVRGGGHGFALAVLQVVLDALGLADEEGDLFPRGFQEAVDDDDGLVEAFGELVVLLVAPGVAQAGELALEDGDETGDFVVEVLEA